MKKSIGVVLAAVVAATLWGTSAFAAGAMSGRDIMDKAYKTQRVALSATLKMIVLDGKGSKSERRLEGRSKQFDGLWKDYQHFEYPPDIAGTSFLVSENKGLADNDLYLYDPVAKRTRRINPAQRSGRYVGTDFYYEDMDVYDVDEDVHTLIREEPLELKVGTKVQKIECYVIESIPKPSKVTSYNKVVSWVEKSNFYTRQTEMYQQDKLVKRFRVFDIKHDHGKWISMLQQVDDLTSGSSTVMQMVKYSLDSKSIPDKVFTEAYLLSGG